MKGEVLGGWLIPPRARGADPAFTSPLIAPRTMTLSPAEMELPGLQSPSMSMEPGCSTTAPPRRERRTTSVLLSDADPPGGPGSPAPTGAAAEETTRTRVARRVRQQLKSCLNREPP